MVMTPYPASNADIENPSILVSEDGTTWAVPDGLANPIQAKPATGNNSDPCLVMSADGLTLYCIYRESDGSTFDKLYIESSTDGVTWGDRAEILSVAVDACASPSVVYDGSQFVMWYVNTAAAQPNALLKRTCATPGGAWSEAATCTVKGVPFGKDLWHLTVLKTAAGYRAFVVLCATGQNGVGGSLYYATSADGDTWQIANCPVISLGATGAWDDSIVYRAAAVDKGGDSYDLWYSAKKADNTWHIGKTAYTA